MLQGFVVSLVLALGVVASAHADNAGVSCAGTGRSGQGLDDSFSITLESKIGLSESERATARQAICAAMLGVQGYAKASGNEVKNRHPSLPFVVAKGVGGGAQYRVPGLYAPDEREEVVLESSWLGLPAHELSYAVSHELAHWYEGHPAKMNWWAFASRAVMLLALAVLAILLSGRVQRRGSAGLREWLAGGGLCVCLLGVVGPKDLVPNPVLGVINLRYEMQADEIAVRTQATQVGMDSAKASAMAYFARFRDQKDESPWVGRTAHPGAQTRIDAIRALR